jgi:zinc D-Ala-D-Ala carboxypeptidase
VGSHRHEPGPRSPRPTPAARMPEAHAVPRPRGATRALGRLGVLGALIGITVVVPVSQAALADAGVPSVFATQVALPSTVDALTAVPSSQLPPASLVSASGAATKISLADVERVSRSVERSPLPGCDGVRRPGKTNGALPESSLCTLFDGHTQLRADAAVALARLNEAYVAKFGADMCLSSGYRTIGQQYAVKAQKGGLAATPGTSNHGWGLAVDFCTKETQGSRGTWLRENGPLYGLVNPSWALPGGSGPHEPWHWEYLKGVQEDGSYFG